MFAWDGRVTTLWAWAWSNRTPSRARRSIQGVDTVLLPYVPRASALRVSMEMSRTERPGSRGMDAGPIRHKTPKTRTDSTRAAPQGRILRPDLGASTGEGGALALRVLANGWRFYVGAPVVYLGWRVSQAFTRAMSRA